MTETRFEHEGLSVVVSRSKDEASVSWRGVSDSRNPAAFLNPIMKDLEKDLQNRHVTIDLSSLEYMNSATVTPLITGIKSFDSVARSVLVVFSDTDWQRTHVQCMRAIARTLKVVRIEVKPAQ
jgi:anti-anti-sigma regulatory factor